MRTFMAIIMLLTGSIEYAMSEGRLHSESFGYIYRSWSHSDTVDTSVSLDSGNGYGKDALYDFTLCKPSIIVIDHAGAVLKNTRMTLTRMYEPVTARWLTPDPLAEKYYSVSPYTFCNNDPINHIDPDGRHVEVTKSKDGSYVVSGGKANENLYIYENYGMKNQHIIGKMLTQYSFMDDDENAVKAIRKAKLYRPTYPKSIW